MDFNNLYKIRICKYWKIKKCAHFHEPEKCLYAHGYNDLKCKNGLINCKDFDCYKCIGYKYDNEYKWTICENFKNGFCKYGKKCNFVHNLYFDNENNKNKYKDNETPKTPIENFEDINKKVNNILLIELIQNLGIIRDDLLKNMNIYEDDIDTKYLKFSVSATKQFINFLEEIKK